MIEREKESGKYFGETHTRERCVRGFFSGAVHRNAFWCAQIKHNGPSIQKIFIDPWEFEEVESTWYENEYHLMLMLMFDWILYLCVCVV